MTEQDREHLQLLSIFHYVVAALAALIACIPLFHFALGIAMMMGALKGGPPEPAATFFGCLMAGLAGLFILLGWAYAFCLALAGRFLARRRHYTFCLVMAAISCVFTPFGTVLGVFTLILLVREPVRLAFEPPAATESA